MSILWGVLYLTALIAAIWFCLAMIVLSTAQRYVVNYSAGQMLFAMGGIVLMAVVILVSVASVFVTQSPGLGIFGTIWSLVLAVSLGAVGWEFGKRDPHWRRA